MADIVRFVSALGEQRQNLVPNPSFEVDTAGWTAANGTLARIVTVQSPQGTALCRYTSTAAVGSGAFMFPAAMPVVVGTTYTASFYVRMGPQTSDHRILLRFYDSGGLSIAGSDVVNIVPLASLSSSTFTRIQVTGTAPVGAVTARILSIASAALTIGNYYDVDGFLLEPGTTMQTYSDGSFAGWVWTGTAHASSSRTDQFSTTNLDLNDEVTFWVSKFNAPPPRLRRSTASNSMRDGIVVGSSSYDARTLTIELECRKDTQDAAAAAIQQLWYQLDQANNWLMYQPQGASRPVFFRTYRSDTSQLEDVVAQAAMRNFTIEVLAEPFALGLRETLGPYTVTNDIAAATNPGYVDIPAVLGDVNTEAVYWNTSTNRAATLMAVRHGSFDQLRTSQQAETLTLLTDTTNPGGGPDAAMSGTGTNNFVRTSFATAALTARLSGNTSATITDQFGSFVVYAAVRRSDNTSVMRVGVSTSSTVAPTETTTVPLTTSRQLVRLGRYTTSNSFNYSAKVGANPNYFAWAARDSGAGTLDWDCIFLVPADTAMLEALSHSWSGSGAGRNVFDGVADRAMSIFTGGNPTTLATEEGPMVSSGRIPPLSATTSSRLHILTCSTYNLALGLRTMSKGDTYSWTVYYWPRYLHVRPVST